MSTWVLIPIKARAACKTRLSGAMAADQRLRLVRAMLRHVIAAACAAPGVDRVALLTNERDEAPEHLPLIADRGHDLNSALRGALPDLRALGAASLVVLPGDLPMLTADDVGELARIAAAGGVAVAPDWLEQGTNAIAGPAALPAWFHFGKDSYLRHLAAAQALGAHPVTVRSDGLAFDLDEPDALHRAKGMFIPGVVRHDPLALARPQ